MYMTYMYMYDNFCIADNLRGTKFSLFGLHKLIHGGLNFMDSYRKVVATSVIISCEF